MAEPEKRCVCGHIVHTGISGTGACQSYGCQCDRFRAEHADDCECEECWRESNMPPVGLWDVI